MYYMVNAIVGDWIDEIRNNYITSCGFHRHARKLVSVSFECHTHECLDSRRSITFPRPRRNKCYCIDLERSITWEHLGKKEEFHSVVRISR
jgi:hypothetical protein